MELPPFISTNTTAISMLVALLDGTIDSVPSLRVSEAVAVQIWRLIFDKDVRVEALQHAGDRGLFVILASLTLGARVETADPCSPSSLRATPRPTISTLETTDSGAKGCGGG